jgi:moderate conductance mechanosensitive channel
MIVHRVLAISCLALAAALDCAALAHSEDGLSVPATASEKTNASQQTSGTPSEAERIARLDRSLQSDEKRLTELKASLANPDREYADAEAEFEQLDAQLAEKRKQSAGRANPETSKDPRKRPDEISTIEKKWTLARDRFELAVRERKAMQESASALEQKIDRDRQALAELRGATPVVAPAIVAEPAVETDSGGPSPVRPQVASHSMPGTTGSASPPSKAVSEANRETGADVTAIKPDLVEPEELVAATAAAQQTETAADVAEHAAQSITERIEILQKNIGLARQLRDTAHKKVDNADQTLKSLSEDLFRKLMEGGDTGPLKQQIQEATERVREARTDSREISKQLDDLQSALVALQSEKLAAVDNADQKRNAAKQAAAVVKELNNPFSIHNLTQWLLDHGPKILAILIAVAAFLRLSRILESRFVSLIANRGRIGNREERENRAKTLLGIFHNAANILIFGGGVVAVLDEVGIPVAPLIGGAAVVGLAVAFGAQSLIKDYFTGFLVLLEQQYLVNDVVKIGQIAGQVERITLRTTMLRDSEGHVHFIPHGQITTVTNTTHGWSRAVFEIRIAYREKIDRATDVLMQLARELCASEAYSGLILDEPVMLGVDALGDSGVIVKFHIKTRPLHQSTIKREMLRRIKNKFDELGIEIPCPQLMVHRHDHGRFGVIADERDRRAG